MNYRNEFEKIIEKISVNSKTPPEEFNDKMQPMLQFIQRNVPNKLYKFRECTENNLDAFENLRHELSKCGIEYPPMKLMDMCFWQDAYIDDLQDRKHHLDEVLEVEG